MKKKLLYSIIAACFTFFGVLAQTHSINFSDTTLSRTRSVEPVAESSQLIIPCSSAISILPTTDSIQQHYTINGIVAWYKFTATPDSLKNNVIKSDSLFLLNLASSTNLGSVDAQLLLEQSGVKKFYEVIDFDGTGTAKSLENSFFKEKSIQFLETPDEYLTVFPNPASDKLIIEYSLLRDLSNCEVEIYTLEGNIIKTQKIKRQFGIEEIDISDISSGIYVLSLCNRGDKDFIRKVTILK